MPTCELHEEGNGLVSCSLGDFKLTETYTGEKCSFRIDLAEHNKKHFKLMEEGN